MKKLWFNRETRSQDFLSSTPRKHNPQSSNLNINDQESSTAIIHKKVEKIQSLTSKLTKLEDFYQIMNSNDYKTMNIRCFEHNNEIILYCIDDHKLLCPNCMFNTTGHGNANINAHSNIHGNGHAHRKDSMTDGRGSLSRSNVVKKEEKEDHGGKHQRHDVKQISKAMPEINNDYKTWSFEIKQLTSDLSNCRLEWEKFRKSYEHSKNLLTSELDKEYDKAQKHLSRSYTQAKKELCDLIEPLNKSIESVVQCYKTINLLLLPNRFPVVCMKHSWMEKMREIIIPEIPTRIEDINTVGWTKYFETQAKMVLKKFVKRRMRVEQDE